MSDGATAAEAAAMEAAAAAARISNITLWTLYAIGVVITALRTYARHVAVGWHRFEMDDYLIWVALILYSIQSTLGYEIGNIAHGMANNGMTDEQRVALLPTDPEFEMRIMGSKIQIAGWTCYSTLVATLKFAMLFFYFRLVNGLGRPYRMRVHLGFVIVFAGWIASLFAIFFSCLPFEQNWQIYPDPGNLCYPAVSRSIVWASFAANFTSDIYLIMIPLPLLWGSRLRLIEKLASTLVLSAGIFVLVCATLKTVFIIVDEVNGAEMAGAWGTREAFVAVATTNLPMVFPLFKTWLRPLLGSSRRTMDKQYKTPDGGFRSIGGGGVDIDSRRTRGTRGANPLTNISFTESEERIVNEIKLQTMRAAAVSAGTTKSGEISDSSEDCEKGGQGIVVLTEFDVSEDKCSQIIQPSSEVKATKNLEPW